MNIALIFIFQQLNMADILIDGNFENNIIELPKIPKLIKKFECHHCGKRYKTKSSFTKHENACANVLQNDIDFAQDLTTNEFTTREIPQELYQVNSNAIDDKQLLKLRSELEQLILSNPMLNLNSPVSTTPLEAIQRMSVEELKARIFQAKRELNGKLDLKISDSALMMVNMFVGKMLGCVEELQAEVMSDPLLRESTKDLLSFAVLSKIPPPLKVSGLYAVNVGVAMQKKKLKTSTIINTEAVEVENV